MTQIIIDRTSLRQHPDNPRGAITEDASLRELAMSIREQGIIQPLIVVPLGDGEYRIVAGHRRHAAARLAEYNRLPCIVRDDLDEDDQLEIMAVENIQRGDLSPIEEARLYSQMKERGTPVPDIAARIGKSDEHVYTTLKLLELPEGIQWYIHSGQLQSSTGVLLERHVKDEHLCCELADRFVANGTTIREARTTIMALTDGSNGKKRQYNGGGASFLKGYESPKRQYVRAGAVLAAHEGTIDVEVLAKAADAACRDCGIDNTTICAACPLSQVVRAIVLFPTVTLRPEMKNLQEEI